MLSYSQGDSEAELLLNKVSENIKNYDNIYINYAYTLKNIEEDINQTNKGSFVTEDEKWRFEMLGVTRIFDGNKLYSISPNKMLYFYEEGYYFEMDETRFVGDSQFRKKIQYVKLIPQDSEAEIKYILLGIDTEFNQIYEVIETGKNETVTTISIVDFEFNLPLDSKLFVFDKEKYQEFYMNILD